MASSVISSIARCIGNVNEVADRIDFFSLSLRKIKAQLLELYWNDIEWIFMVILIIFARFLSLFVYIHIFWFLLFQFSTR